VESPYDFSAVHWDHEPGRSGAPDSGTAPGVIGAKNRPCRRPAFRFMERGPQAGRVSNLVDQQSALNPQLLLQPRMDADGRGSNRRKERKDFSFSASIGERGTSACIGTVNLRIAW
jgi:hypothetical protein